MKRLVLLLIVLGFVGQSWGQEQKSFKEKHKVNLLNTHYKFKDSIKESKKVNIIFNAKGDTISYQKDKALKQSKEEKFSEITLTSIDLSNSYIRADLKLSDNKIYIYPHRFKLKDTANDFFDDNEVFIKMKDRTNYSFPYSSLQMGIITIPVKWYVDSQLGNIETSINAMFNVGYKWGKSHFIKFPHEKDVRQYRSAQSLNFIAGLSKIALNKSNTSKANPLEGNIAAVSLGVSYGVHYGDFTFLLASGFDIPTSNRRDWNFTGKPWIGMGFGLNFLKFN